jgi:hypothetical protein
LRRAAREGQQQDALRIGTLRDEVRHAVRQCAGLAGTGPGDDQQRPHVVERRADAMLDRDALRVVEHGQRGGQALGLGGSRTRWGAGLNGVGGRHRRPHFTGCPSSCIADGTMLQCHNRASLQPRRFRMDSYPSRQLSTPF